MNKPTLSMKRLTLFLLALTFASQGWGQGIQMDTIRPTRIQSVGVNLSRYSGADPTGVADSTVAINAALADANSQGLPILCDGTFKITSTLNTIDPATMGFVSYRGCTIKAGASMTNMAVIGGTAPPPYDKGWMQGIEWDGNNLAAHALFLGCSGVSCSTNYVNGYLFLGVRVKNTTGDGVQTGNNVWQVGWVGGGIFNGGGNGYTLQGGNNAGEAIGFTKVDFANNSGWGIGVGNAGAGGQSVSCDGCAFDQNVLGQIQNGTVFGNGQVFTCSGCHLEYNSLSTTTRWLQNFGEFTCSGCFFTGGTGNSTYQIDNEGNLSILNGAINNGGSGTVFNSGQSGNTITWQVANYAVETSVNFAVDTSGNIVRSGTITSQSSSATALSLPNGGANIGGFVVTGSGFKPTTSGGQGALTGDGTNLTTSVKMIAAGLTASGSSLIQNGQTTVASLPSAASNPGAMILVTDSTAVAAEGQTCAGSSTNKALAVSTGSQWKCF